VLAKATRVFSIGFGDDRSRLNPEFN